MNKRALVTGGCGFIGSNLSRGLLEKGWKVDIVDDMSSGHLELLDGCKMRVVPMDLMSQFEDSSFVRTDATLVVYQGGFAHINLLKRIVDRNYDVVFHQAAIPRVLYSVENPSRTTQVNILETIKLFEACVGNVGRVVTASSSSVYGGADILPTNELSTKNPKSPYAWQKSAIEDAAKMFCSLYDIDIICLRYFNVFGPGQYGDSPYSTAVSAWCNSIKDTKPLRCDGDGSQSRDLCYVDNVVHANILAALSNKRFIGECYNVACGDRTSNREILDYLTSKFSHAVVINAPWRQGDVMHTQADITKIKEDLGYEPLIRFWDGLEKTIAWWGLADDV